MSDTTITTKFKAKDEQSTTVDKMTSAIDGYAKAALAAAAALVAVVKIADKLAGQADEVGKASQRLSVSVETYQRWASMVQHAGSTMGALVTTHRKLLMNMTLLEQGTKRQIDLFREVGVSVKNADGTFRDQESVLTDVMIKLSEMEDITRRNMLAQELLGRSSNQLNPILNEGADAIRDYMEGNESAIVVTENMAKVSAKYADEMQTLGETIKRQVNFVF